MEEGARDRDERDRGGGYGGVCESCEGPQEEGVSKRGVVNKAQHCREFQEVRSESRSEPAKAEKAWERGWSGCRHKGQWKGSAGFCRVLTVVLLTPGCCVF